VKEAGSVKLITAVVRPGTPGRVRRLIGRSGSGPTVTEGPRIRPDEVKIRAKPGRTISSHVVGRRAAQRERKG
jgi:hypothetical protein